MSLDKQHVMGAAAEASEPALVSDQAPAGLAPAGFDQAQCVCERMRAEGYREVCPHCIATKDWSRSPTPSEVAVTQVELLKDIAVMMSEFVDNWPQPRKVGTALKLIAKTIRTALGPSLHTAPPTEAARELVDAVREECAKVCDRHIDLPLCRQLFGDQGRGAFGMTSHLATDIRSASFHDSKRVNQAVTALEASSRQEERLRSALERLVSVADMAADTANTSLMDEAIQQARAALEPPHAKDAADV